MIEITADNAIEALRHVVQEQGGDYRYERPNGGPCLYVHNDQPSCGVGRALAKLNVPLSVLQAMDTGNGDGGGLAARAMVPFLENHDVNVAWSARDLFEDFQRLQDNGATWAAALEQAEHRYRIIKGV